jgi:integrase/recombinase XerD
VSTLRAFENFLIHQRRLSNNTVSAYLSDLAIWESFGLDLESPFGRAEILSALEKMQNQNLEDSTLFRRRISLRAYINYLAIKNPDIEILLPELSWSFEENFDPKALECEEIEQLLKFPINEKQPESLRDKALLELIYAAGLRVSEVIALDWQDLDERLPSLRVMGKGKKQRLVPISERALYWLLQYKEKIHAHWSQKADRKFQSKIFLSRRLKSLTRMAVWKILRKRCLEQAIDVIHPHVLRHSFATHLIRGGADVRFVQALLGHSKINTTQRYLKVEDEDLRKMVLDFHPLMSLDE